MNGMHLRRHPNMAKPDAALFDYHYLTAGQVRGVAGADLLEVGTKLTVKARRQ